MDVIEDYRRRAAECERLAAAAVTEDHRLMILKIAETWRLKASQRERMGLAKSPQSSPMRAPNTET